MALYLGRDKIKVNLDGVIYCLGLYSKTPVIETVMLLSSDGSILQDINGLYLTTKEDG